MSPAFSVSILEKVSVTNWPITDRGEVGAIDEEAFEKCVGRDCFNNHPHE